MKTRPEGASSAGSPGMGMASGRTRTLRAVVLVLVSLGSRGATLAQVQTIGIVGEGAGGTRAVAVDGELAVANQGATLHTWDISDPVNPSQLGKVLLPGIVEDVVLDDGFAYAAINRVGLAVVDVTDPSLPTALSVRNVSGAPLALAKREHLVYLASNAADLKIFSVASPSAPEIVGTAPAGGFSVHLHGEYLYLGGSGDLSIWSIVNPTIPVQLSTVAMPALVEAIQVTGTTAVVSVNNGTDVKEVRTLDVSNPPTPVVLDTFTLSDQPRGLVSLGDIVFLASDFNGLAILDVSNPSDITQIDFVPFAHPIDLALVSADYLLAGSYQTASVLTMIDISTPASSVIAWESNVVGGSFFEVAVKGNLAFVSGGQPTVFDVSDPRNPVVVSSMNIGNPNGGKVAGDTWLIANRDNGLEAYDVSNPSSPTFLSRAGTGGIVVQAALAPPYAYVADNVEGLRIIDFGNPAALTELAVLGFGGIVTSVAEQEGLVYVAAGAAGLRIVDVSDPATPTEIGSLVISNTQGVAVEGDRAYLMADGFRVVNVSNPAAPLELGLLSNVSFGGSGIAIREGLAYLSSFELFIVDIRDDNVPTVLASTNGSTDANASAIRDFAYVAGGNDGLTVHPIPPPPPMLDPLPLFRNADVTTVAGTAFNEGAFITVGGGEFPQFQQLEAGQTAFSVEVPLKQGAANTLSVTTMNEFGLVSLPAIHVLVEGDAYPATVEGVTALAVTPNPAPAVALNDSLPFSCTATFSDASMADVTQFIGQLDAGGGTSGWSVTNKEVITSGGLVVNSRAGAATVQARVTQPTALGGVILSNAVSVADGP